MRSEPLRTALLDIRDNIHRARAFVAGLDFTAFQSSLLHVYAAVRALEIVSEASRRLPDDMRARYPQLPWRAIRDSGNFYRHQYDNVLESYVWTTIHDDLPPLLLVVEQELRALDEMP